MPYVFDHGSNLNWSERQDFHLRPRGPKPRALKTELRSDEEWRIRRESHPQPSRRQRGALLIELRIQKWWEVLVTLQFVASDTCLKTPDLQSGSRITSLKIGRGGGSCAHGG